jgi:hypothetical protein
LRSRERFANRRPAGGETWSPETYGFSTGLRSIARPNACWDHTPGRPAMKRQLKAEVLSARIER